MADNIKTTIVKLNNENYFVWKFRMELLLIKEGVWDVITKTAPVLSADHSNQSAYDAWKKSDDKARANIGLMVEDSQLSHIRSKTTAKEMWDSLKEYHEKSTLSNKVILMRQICGSKMEEDGDMELHIGELTNLFQRLVALGETQLSDSWTVAMILSSLPPSYSTLVTALETRPEADLTLSLVQSKLIGEYRQRKANEKLDSYDGTESAMKLSQREAKLCFFCDQEGHFKSSCPSYILWKEKRERKHTEQAKLVEGQQPNRHEQDEEYLFMISTHEHNNIDRKSTWYVDSAATSHASGNNKLFTTLVYGEYRDATIAGNRFVKVFGKGTIRISLVNEMGQVASETLSDVLFIPDLGVNLLSVKVLTANGMEVNFRNHICEIVKENLQIGTAIRRDGLYELQQPDQQRLYEPE